MAKSIIVKCENCGKEIKKYQSQIKNSKMFFCTQSCQHKWRTGRTGTINNPKGITKKCLCCDKEFYVYPCEINTKIYCSNTCMYKHKSDNGDYSGKNCNFYVRGYYEDDRYPNWEKQKKAARKRDNNTCQECGLTAEEQGESMCVHHKIPYRFFDDYKKANRLNNLICLCRKCHGKQESHRWVEIPNK